MGWDEAEPERGPRPPLLSLALRAGTLPHTMSELLCGLNTAHEPPPEALRHVDVPSAPG